MKRLIATLALLHIAAPLFAQEEGFCMSPCGYQPSGSVLTFECQNAALARTLTEEGMPVALFENVGEFSVAMSERNREMGFNVVVPGEARIFYPCGLPLQ